MDMDELARQALTLPSPWFVEGAEVDNEARMVEVRVRHGSSRGSCPECGKECGKHDSTVSRWRHLDMWNYETWIVCSVPRWKCAEHGVLKMQVPWADGWARFTAQFECVAIDWLKVASMTSVAKNLRITWDQINGIQERAVARGLSRREAITPTRIGVDETSFQKRHEYVTIVTDLETSRVLHVADGRGKASLNSFFEGLTASQCASVEVVAMDMHLPYIYAAAEHVTDITNRLCFDRFHVAQLFSKAVDTVRRAETKRLSKEGDDRLKGSRYALLMAKRSLPPKLRRQLAIVFETASCVSDVWAIKEAASKLWSYKTRTWANKAWIALAKVARKLEIPALDKVIDTVLRHLFGIVNAIVHGVSNAASESVNSRVQALKRRANGYRRRDRFRAAILFHLGQLDLYPDRAVPLQTQ